MGVRVVDNASGQVVEVDSADAGRGFLDGRYGLPDVGRVRVRLQDGTVGDVAPNEAHVVLREGGSLLDEQQYEAARPTTLGEDIDVAGRAFAEGIAPGAGEGALLQQLQDAPTEHAREEVRGAMRQLRMEAERSPTAHTVGELAGMIAGSALVPGAGAEEAGVGMLGRLGRSAVEEGTMAALQQAPASTTRVLAEDALGDHHLAAEQMLAQVGMETLLAGGIGGVFGVGSRLAGQGVEAIGRQLMPAIRSAVTDTALRRFAEESAFKASGAMLRDFRRVTRSMGNDAPSRIGRRLLDEGVVTMDATLEDVAARAAQRTEQHGQQIGELLGRLDDVPPAGYRGPPPARPDVDRILSRIDGEVLEPLRRSPFHRNVLDQVEGALGGFAERFGTRIRQGAEGGEMIAGEPLTFTGLHEQRRALDDLIWRNRGPNPPQWIEEARSARRIIEEELEQQGQAAAERLGTDFATQYRNAKEGYAAMRTARDVANDRLLRDQANRFFSPSDYGIGSVASILHGGINPGSLAMGFVMGALHKVARERGRAFIAAGLDRVSRLGLLRRTAEQADRRLSEALSGFIREGGRRAARGARRELVSASAEAFHERVRDLMEDSAPQRRVEQIAQATRGFADVAPKTTAALAATVQRRDAFLRSRLPPALGRDGTLQPHLQRAGVSDLDRARFMRYVRAADDPMAIVEDLEHGRITRENVEALREVYPRLYERLQQQVLEQVASAKEQLPYPVRLQLGVLLDIPTDPSLRPESIAMLQARYVNQPSEPPTPAPVANGPSPELAASSASDTDRLVARRNGVG